MQNNLQGKDFALRLGFFWSNFKSGYLNLKNDSIFPYSHPKAKSEHIESFIILDSVDSTSEQRRASGEYNADAQTPYTRSKIILCVALKVMQICGALEKKVGGQQPFSWVKAESWFTIPSVSSISRERFWSLPVVLVDASVVVILSFRLTVSFVLKICIYFCYQIWIRILQEK